MPGNAGGSIRTGRLLKAAQELEVEKDMREKRKVRALQVVLWKKNRWCDGCSSAVQSSAALEVGEKMSPPRSNF